MVEPTGAVRLQLVTPEQQTPVQRERVRSELLPRAEERWWAPGHPGWTIYDPDGLKAIAQVCGCAAPSFRSGSPGVSKGSSRCVVPAA
jgi:hypothetical protein